MERQKAVQTITHAEGLTRRNPPSTNVGPAAQACPPSHQVSYSCTYVGFSVPLAQPFSILLLQGAALRADQCFATARSSGRPRCRSSPSCSSITSPSSWPRPVPSTASPSSTVSQAAAVHSSSSLPRWLSQLLKAQPQLPQESHSHSHPTPLAGVPEKLGLSRRPRGRHPWEATPLSGVPAPLGPALTHPPLPPAPLLQSRPQQQRVSPCGATLVLLCGLPPPSSH